MRLVVKQNDRTVNEFRFGTGPIYIGRHTHSQIFLPDRAVSRQHAVIFSTQGEKWMVEDLDSANKTYLNDQAVHKVEIKTGDILRIVDFTIEIDLESDIDVDKTIHLEDTLIPGVRESQIIIRRPDSEYDPDVRLPAKRVKDFMRATEAICKADSPDQLLQALLSITLRQLTAFHSWCALRNQPTGPMTAHAGKRRDGQLVELDEIKLKEKITQAVEEKQFFLLPQIPAQTEEQRIRSAMIAPIIDPTGCFGVLYVDNAMDHEHYTLSDLDYLMLLAIHTAAILENF